MQNRKTDWARIGVAFFSLFVLGFLDNTRGPFFSDILRDLNLSDTRGSLFFVATSTMTIFAGRLTPLFTRLVSIRWVMSISQALMGLGFVGVSFSQNLTSLLVFAVLFGIGFGFINVGQNILILEGASLRLRRQLFSGLHSVYAMASLCAPMVIGILSSMGMTWREAFRLIATLCVAGFFACFAIERTKKSQVIEAKLEDPLLKKGIQWMYLPIAVQLSFYIAAEVSLSTRLVLFLRRTQDMSVTEAAQYLTAFFALLMLGRLVFTFFPFRRFGNKTVMMTSIVVSLMCYFLGLVFTPVLLVLCGFTMAPAFGATMDYLAELFPQSTDEAITWVLAASGLFIITMHYLVGVLSDQIGLRTALYIGPVCLLLSAIMLAKIKPSRQSLGTSAVKA